MGDLSRSHNNQHHLWSQKMGLKLATLLLFLSLLNISLGNPAKDDSNQHLANSAVKPIAANQAGHELAKREASRGRKGSCQGKRCSKKRTHKKAKKGKKANQKPKNNEKKSKKRKGGKKKTSQKKNSKEQKQKKGSRRTGSS